jgi:hypothetical protein
MRNKNQTRNKNEADPNSVNKGFSESGIGLRASLPTSPCGFYRLQQRLREEGWYIEWTEATQAGHAWEDMDVFHQAGPYKGHEVDFDKCLISYIGDDLMREIAARKISSVSPESFGGNWFMFDPDGCAVENIKAITSIFEECGCRVREAARADEIWIEWDVFRRHSG